jgi:hypothetical protein
MFVSTPSDLLSSKATCQDVQLEHTLYQWAFTRFIGIAWMHGPLSHRFFPGAKAQRSGKTD